MKGLTRYRCRDCMGWYAYVYKGGGCDAGKPFVVRKLFTDKKYGGTRKAQLVALKWLMEAREKLRVPNTNKKVIRWRAGKRAGVTQQNGSWIATMKSGNKRATRFFSIKKLGAERAKELAEKQRERWESEVYR